MAEVKVQKQELRAPMLIVDVMRKSVASQIQKLQINWERSTKFKEIREALDEKRISPLYWAVLDQNSTYFYEWWLVCYEDRYYWIVPPGPETDEWKRHGVIPQVFIV